MTHTSIFFHISFTFGPTESRTFDFINVCDAQDRQATEDVIWRSYTRLESKRILFSLKKHAFLCFLVKLGGFTRAIKKKTFVVFFAKKTCQKFSNAIKNFETSQILDFFFCRRLQYFNKLPQKNF